MLKVTKKPVTVTAVKYDGLNYEEIQEFIGEKIEPVLESDSAYEAGQGPPIFSLPIKTDEGVMKVMPGDYVICGTRGEFYPCKPDVFADVYGPELNVLNLKENFDVVVDGSTYHLPCYKVVPGVGIVEVPKHVEVNFVRGDKEDEGVVANDGTLHEHIISMMVHDLNFKNNMVPCKETSLAIDRLEEALGWLRQRSVDRMKRSVQGTYRK